MRTADVNVTEKVAQVIASDTDEPMWSAVVVARNALAALAAPEVLAGIAGVLAEHDDSRWSAAWSLLVCRCGEAVDDHAVHQAAVVVEWLRGQG